MLFFSISGSSALTRMNASQTIQLSLSLFLLGKETESSGEVFLNSNEQGVHHNWRCRYYFIWTNLKKKTPLKHSISPPTTIESLISP